MIAKKVFVSDGINKRFLSDFIIRSEQFTRVYNYVYDPGGIAGDIDPASGLFIRTNDAPTSDDLQTIDKWDLVDNSISFYISPHTGSKVWIEVATTAEEFGDTLIQPTVAQAEAARDIAVAKALLTDADATATAADVVLTHADVVLTHADVVLTHADAASTAADAIATAADAAATAADVLSTNADAASTAADAIATAADAASTAADVLATAADVVSSGTNATNAQLKAWEAEAFRLTAQSYATEAEDVLVNVVTSDGDGTFTYTPQAGVYSALHWDAKAVLASVSAVQKAGDTMTGNLEAPSMSIGGDYLSPFGFKNFVINGNFAIWQRATSQTTNGYDSDDRWLNNISGTTIVHSRQTATDTERALFSSNFFSRTVVTSVAGVANFSKKSQKIEDITKLAGKTVTLSFWAKADIAKNIALEFYQDFGTGGTPSALVLGIGSQLIALTTTWAKYSVTVTMPSIVGKTLGTDGLHTTSTVCSFWFDAGSNHDARTASLGQQSGTFDIAEVQIEEGSVATPFEQRLIGLEFNLCSRYYQVLSTIHPQVFQDASTLRTRVVFTYLTRMRDIPTVTTTTPTTTNCSWSAGLTELLSITDSSFIIYIKATTSGMAGVTISNVYLDAEL